MNVAVRLESVADPGGICISGKVFDELEGKLSLPFEDLGEQRLKNIARPIHVYALKGADMSPREPKAARPSPNHTDRPSIAVLPFANLSGDPEQEYFAEGITDDIITALTKTRWLFVTARSSSFAFKGKAIETEQVARRLGRSLHPQWQRAAERRPRPRLGPTGRGRDGRLSFGLNGTTATSGTSWSSRIEIAEEVAGAIEPELLRKEGQRGRGAAAEPDRLGSRPARHVGVPQDRPRVAPPRPGAVPQGDRGRAQLCRRVFLAGADRSGSCRLRMERAIPRPDLRRGMEAA